MTLVILLLGLGVGVLVGLLGIGGGVVLVPAMVYLLGMDQHLAQGTSLFILLPPIGLGALREYWNQGQVDLRAGILCAIGMLLGAYGGSFVALTLASRHCFGDVWNWRWGFAGPAACLAVWIQPAQGTRNESCGADSSDRSAGVYSVCEGGICFVESGLVADSG